MKPFQNSISASLHRSKVASPQRPCIREAKRIACDIYSSLGILAFRGCTLSVALRVHDVYKTSFPPIDGISAILSLVLQ